MTGYDHKKVELSHDGRRDVTFAVEIDFLCDQTWQTYREITVPAGEVFEHVFPKVFSAHWVRVTANRACMATPESRTDGHLPHPGQRQPAYHVASEPITSPRIRTVRKATVAEHGTRSPGGGAHHVGSQTLSWLWLCCARLEHNPRRCFPGVETYTRVGQLTDDFIFP